MKKLLIASIVLTLLFGCSDKKDTLYVYSWSDYFDPELITKFETENNCHVDITSFDSNESMYAKLKAGGSGYDVLVPSSYLIPTLVNENMLVEIDHSMISNVLDNFDHSFDSQVLDNKFKWSVPYACSYTGIMYLKEHEETITSWNIFANQKYNKKISLLDDVRELIGIGLMYNGHSLNSTNKNEIKEAAKTVIEWKKNIRKFDSEAYKTEVASKSIWFGHGYSSDAAQVIIGDERDDVGFALPDEGFTIAWDELVIMKTSKNKALAHKFIDFFYDNENSYKNILYMCSLMPNKNSITNIPSSYQDLLVPKNIEKGQLLKGFTDEKVLEYYNDAFDMIKSTKE